MCRRSASKADLQQPTRTDDRQESRLLQETGAHGFWRSERCIMARRTLNYRLAKTHRNYTVEEVAGLYSVHRNTVRQWIKQGLPTVDRRRPTLVLGRDLSAFLRARRLKNKRPCQPGEIYCVRCRAPRHPAGGLAEYRPTTLTLGNLIGICPSCDGVMYRRVNPAKLDEIRGEMEIARSQAPSDLGERAHLSVNSDSRQDAATHGSAQPR